MKPHDQELGIFAPPRPDFQTGGFTPLSRRRSHQAQTSFIRFLPPKNFVRFAAMPLRCGDV
jgi:hypothetical protein